MSTTTRVAAHTPGPWEVAEAKRYEGGEPITEELFVRAPEDDDPATSSINEVAQANARLIAAAPDLLAALRLAQAWFTARPAQRPDFTAVRDAMEAAIAKAEGRQP